MFMCFTKLYSEINSIYSGQKLFSYKISLLKVNYVKTRQTCIKISKSALIYFRFTASLVIGIEANFFAKFFLKQIIELCYQLKLAIQ
jgi:hypothetical protein